MEHFLGALEVEEQRKEPGYKGYKVFLGVKGSTNADKDTQLDQGLGVGT